MQPESTVPSKALVCVVDANPKFRADVVTALTSFYEVVEHSEQGAALEWIAFHPPAAVILDENVVPRGGLPLLREIFCVPELDRVPIICTATNDRSMFLADAIGLGARTTLVKPFRRSALLQALSKEINGKVERSWVRIEPVQRAALQRTTQAFNAVADLIVDGKPLPYQILSDACGPLVQSVQAGRYKDMLNAVKDHDNYTYVHSLRVSIFLSVFGYSIGIRDRDLVTIASGGLIHDAGKMSVPYHILNKTDRLTDEEMQVMRDHVTQTATFLRSSRDLPQGALLIAEQHHEKLDGSGYPRGLKGTQLNELSRMATIIDIFSALTDRRVYKEAMEPAQALHLMTQLKGQLDQSLLKMFKTVLLDTAHSMI
ncbi:MAG TPA: HD domain-containing protein [Rhodospirillaceae bacterium]|nr:HD domain-containing protein [Rhodospirillaceae bacterium]